VKQKKIAVVIARGGSKRIPKKNIKSFLGKPIIEIVIKIIKSSKIFDEIIVSTDNSNIAKIAKKNKVKVPFIRPKNLANDFADTISVMKHAVVTFSPNNSSDNIYCCIYPTSVFMTKKDLQLSSRVFDKSKPSFLFAATSFEYPYQRGFFLSKSNNVKLLNKSNYFKRTQDLKILYHDVGQFYWGSEKSWKKEKMIFGKKSKAFLISNHRVTEIDTLNDWKRAETLYKLLK
tara:strand:- start:101 stop:793 length:693 start_codon:yes stop_codon:yes gene_type:complete